MTRIVPSHDALATYEVQENGDLVVLGPGGDRLVVLNPVGAAVYELADGLRDLDEIAAIVGDTVGAPRQVVREDVGRFVRDLEARGLLRCLERA